MSLIRSVVALVLTLPAGIVWAADGQETSDMKAAARNPASSSPSTGRSEVFRNIVIPPGKDFSIDSTLDYSSANSVAVTVQCTTCNSSSSSLSGLGLTLQARWLVDGADYYVATENKTATAFPYWDAGGAIFNVYGSQFRLNLQNRGEQIITLQQVTVFVRPQ